MRASKKFVSPRKAMAMGNEGVGYARGGLPKAPKKAKAPDMNPPMVRDMDMDGMKRGGRAKKKGC